MNNKLTPMKRLNTNFRTLKQLMLDGYKQSSFNDVETNDFLLIFQKKEDDLSVTFFINYLNDFENPDFKVSIKYDSVIIDESIVMDINDFKEKLNLLNKTLATETKKEKIDLISKIFLSGTFNANIHHENAENEILEFVGDSYHQYSNSKINYKKHKKELNVSEKKSVARLSKLEEYKKVKELEILLEKAKDDLLLKRLNIEKEENIPAIKLKLELELKNICDTGSNVRHMLRKFGNKFPSLIAKRFKEITDFKRQLNSEQK